MTRIQLIHRGVLFYTPPTLSRLMIHTVIYARAWSKIRTSLQGVNNSECSLHIK